MNKFLLAFTLTSFALCSTSGYALDATRCAPPAANEPVIQQNEFHWGYSHEEMAAKFQEIYASGKRLAGRAYWDSRTRSVMIPYQAANRIVPIKVPEIFWKSVTRQVEISLERKYAEWVFFPDLGHSHFFIPDADWPALAQIPTEQGDVLMARMMRLPGLRVLYHTAEQLKVKSEGNKGSFPQDDKLLWRYFSRNPVGDNRGGNSVDIFFAHDNQSYNTLRDLPGHRYWGGGFNISASEKGCFPYQSEGRTLYFDLSFQDFPAAPGEPTPETP